MLWRLSLIAAQRRDHTWSNILHTFQRHWVAPYLHLWGLFCPSGKAPGHRGSQDANSFPNPDWYLGKKEIITEAVLVYSGKELSLHAICKFPKRRGTLWKGSSSSSTIFIYTWAPAQRQRSQWSSKSCSLEGCLAPRGASPPLKTNNFIWCLLFQRLLCGSYHPEISISLLAPHCYIHLRSRLKKWYWLTDQQTALNGILDV